MIDRDQLTEALAVYAEPLIEFSNQTGMEKKHLRLLVAAAQALLDFPTDEQVEAARFPILDTLAMMASKWLRIPHEEAMGREDIQEAATIVTVAQLEAVRRVMIGDTDE